MIPEANRKSTNAGLLSGPPAYLVENFSVYDPTLALATAEAAVAVYREPEEFSVEVTRAGFRGGNVISRGSAQLGIAWSPEVIVVAARGSSDKGDWRDDFRSVFRVGWTGVLPPGVRVGWGFREQARSLLPPLLAQLGRLQELFPGARLYVTGHSLGAAVATLLVPALEAEEERRLLAGDAVSAPWFVPSCAYPHSSPRVGNRAWQGWYDARYTNKRVPTFSVVHVNGREPDLVTRIPKKRWGFRHVGVRVIHDAGQVLFGEQAWQRYRARNPVGMLAAWRIISRLRRSVRAHFGSELLGVLRAALPRKGATS